MEAEAGSNILMTLVKESINSHFLYVFPEEHPLTYLIFSKGKIVDDLKNFIYGHMFTYWTHCILHTFRTPQGTAVPMEIQVRRNGCYVALQSRKQIYYLLNEKFGTLPLL